MANTPPQDLSNLNFTKQDIEYFSSKGPFSIEGEFIASVVKGELTLEEIPLYIATSIDPELREKYQWLREVPGDWSVD